jgi:hypothetical protein
VVAYKRWQLRVINPGSNPEKVEEWLLANFNMTPRQAGNATYRSMFVTCPIQRPEADALAKELNNLGAYVFLRETEVLLRDDLPNGYVPGPDNAWPVDPRPPGFYNSPPHSPEHLALFEKWRQRRQELEALDKEDGGEGGRP